MKLKVIETKLKLQVRPQGQQRITAVFSLVAIALLLSGCSLLFGGHNTDEPTPEEAEDRVIVPTFTPSPELPPTATPEPIEEQPPVVEVVPTVEEDASTEDPAAEEVAAESP